MEIISFKKYPLSLGIQGKNQLKSARGVVSGGRWVNINHDDWSNPEWVKVGCRGILYDRALGRGRYTQYNSDLAIFTYYIDPVWEMPVYDLLPIYSPLFDTDREPEGNYKDFNDWVTLEQNFGYIPALVPQEIPIVIMGQFVALGLFGYYIGKFKEFMPNFK